MAPPVARCGLRIEGGAPAGTGGVPVADFTGGTAGAVGAPGKTFAGGTLPPGPPLTPPTRGGGGVTVAGSTGAPGRKGAASGFNGCATALLLSDDGSATRATAAPTTAPATTPAPIAAALGPARDPP